MTEATVVQGTFWAELHDGRAYLVTAQRAASHRPFLLRVRDARGRDITRELAARVSTRKAIEDAAEVHLVDLGRRVGALIEDRQ